MFLGGSRWHYYTQPANKTSELRGKILSHKSYVKLHSGWDCSLWKGALQEGEKFPHFFKIWVNAQNEEFLCTSGVFVILFLGGRLPSIGFGPHFYVCSVCVCVLTEKPGLKSILTKALFSPPLENSCTSPWNSIAEQWGRTTRRRDYRQWEKRGQHTGNINSVKLVPSKSVVTLSVWLTLSF